MRPSRHESVARISREVDTARAAIERAAAQMDDTGGKDSMTPE